MTSPSGSLSVDREGEYKVEREGRERLHGAGDERKRRPPFLFGLLKGFEPKKYFLRVEAGLAWGFGTRFMVSQLWGVGYESRVVFGC
jgi:hypothetical protein